MLTLSARGAKARPITKSQRSVDLDALANMLIAETGFNRNRAEMAQIVYIALNRSKKWGDPISRIVAPGYSGATVPWNAKGVPYRVRFNEADVDPRWEAAREFAASVMDNASGYRNLGLTSFLHPGGMPTPPCSSGRSAVSTAVGTRCLPSKYASGAKTVGGALFA
jgi:hypothetical protein